MPDGLGERALKHGLVKMMAPSLARGAVDVEAGCREDPLPWPFVAGVWVLACEGPGQFDPAGAASQVGIMLVLRPLKMLDECWLDYCWEHGGAILRALAVTDDDLVRREVDILNSQTTALEEAQAGAIEQRRHEPLCAVELADDGAHLVAAENDREVSRPLGPDDVIEPGQILMQNVPVEKQKSAERLVLGRGGDPALDRQGAQKPRDLSGTHLGGMALAVEEDVAADPADVRLLGAATAVAKADGLAHAVEKPWRTGAGFAHEEAGARRSGITDGAENSGCHS